MSRLLLSLICILVGCTQSPEQPAVSPVEPAEQAEATKPVEPVKPTEPVEPTGPTQEEAKKALTKVLDSWVFGESCEKFRESNPHWSLRDGRDDLNLFGKEGRLFKEHGYDRNKPRFTLIQYNIGPVRPGEDPWDFEFAVTVTLDDWKREKFEGSLLYRVSHKDSGPNKGGWAFIAEPAN